MNRDQDGHHPDLIDRSGCAAADLSWAPAACCTQAHVRGGRDQQETSLTGLFGLGTYVGTWDGQHVPDL